MILGCPLVDICKSHNYKSFPFQKIFIMLIVIIMCFIIGGGPDPMHFLDLLGSITLLWRYCFNPHRCRNGGTKRLINLSEVIQSESGEARPQPKNLTPGPTLLITAFLQRKKCNNLISVPINKSCNPVSHTGTNLTLVPGVSLQMRREVQIYLIRQVSGKHCCEPGTD